MTSQVLLSKLHDSNPRKDDRAILTFQKDGYILQIGCNAFSNDRIISEHPHKECLWLHATAARGSHLILCVSGKESPPQLVLDWAAALALRNSKSEARTISIALLKNLYKPEGANPGVFKCEEYETMEVPV